RHGRLYTAFERMFNAWLSLYDVTLRASLRWHAATMALSLALVAGTIYLFLHTSIGFLPSEDTGRFNIITEAIQGIGFDEMVRHHRDVAAVLAVDPNVSTFGSILGFGPLNSGRFAIDAKPRNQRPLSVDQVIEELRPKLAQLPGLRTYPLNPPPISIG